MIWGVFDLAMLHFFLYILLNLVIWPFRCCLFNKHECYSLKKKTLSSSLGVNQGRNFLLHESKVRLFLFQNIK